MHNEQNFSNLIYEYLLMRFRFQYYKYGDYLPITDILCREFSVSSQTIKSAYKRLREDGYIAVQGGKPAMVTYKQSEDERIKFITNFFSERIHAYSDLSKTLELVSVPLLVEGFRRMNKHDFAHLHHFIERANSDDIIYVYCYIFQKLDNPLVMNLYWETALYMGLLFIGEKGDQEIYDKSVIRNEMANLISFCDKEDWDGLKDSLIRNQQHSMEESFAYIRQTLNPVVTEERRPFVWHIYRERPQLCYSLTTRILHEMYRGEYRGRNFLPSYQKMAEKYNVSVNTVRRAVRLLGQLGVVCSMNGIGTHIFSSNENCNAPDLTNSSIRLNLAFFFQAFELLTYSCEEIIRICYQSLPLEAKAELIRQMEEHLVTSRCETASWTILISIAKYSPIEGVREIYGKIYGLFLWGYPLMACKNETPNLDKAMRLMTESVIKHLKANEFDQCAAAFKKFVTDEFPMTEQFFINSGFKMDELRLSPLIRFLLMEE